jgi:hypothetical protein
MSLKMPLLVSLLALGCGSSNPTPPAPFVPLDQPGPTRLTGRAEPVAGVSCCGTAWILSSGSATLRRAWDEGGAFAFDELPAGHVTVVLDDGHGSGAVVEAVLQPHGLNDLGTVALRSLGDFPQLLELRGIGLEERLTTGSADLEQPVLSSDGKWVYALRGEKLVRIDTETGEEVILSDAYRLRGVAPRLSLASDRYLVITEMSPDSDTGGRIFDLQKRDRFNGDPKEYLRTVYYAAAFQLLHHVWVAGDGLNAVVSTTFLDNTTGRPRNFVKSLHYDGEHQYPTVSDYVFPYPENPAMTITDVGHATAGEVFIYTSATSRVSLLGHDDTGQLEVLPAPAVWTSWALDDDLVVADNTNLVERRDLRTGTVKASFDVTTSLRPNTSAWWHHAEVASFDRARHRVLVADVADPVNLGPEFRVGGYFLLDLDGGRVTPVPLDIREGARTLPLDPYAGDMPPMASSLFLDDGTVQLVFFTDSSFRGDVAVLQWDGTNAFTRFFAGTWEDHFADFKLWRVGSLEARLVRDATGHQQVFAAARGLPDKEFTQRTFVSADHSHLMTPGGQRLLYLARDPASGREQLFRIDLSP